LHAQVGHRAVCSNDTAAQLVQVALTGESRIPDPNKPRAAAPKVSTIRVSTIRSFLAARTIEGGAATEIVGDRPARWQVVLLAHLPVRDL
jgi:hypothetical protein